MKKKQNENWPAVIVVNGRPYQLKKIIRQDFNDPCFICDLSEYCKHNKGFAGFYTLCTSDNRNDAWYFEEDWTIYDNMIADFVDTKRP